MKEKLILMLDECLTEATRHDLCPSDMIAVSASDGETVVFRQGSKDASVITPGTTDSEARAHLEIFAARPDTKIVLSLSGGFAADCAKRGESPALHSRLAEKLFPRGIPCVGSASEAESGAKAFLLTGKGAYVAADEPSAAVEAALALEYVAKVGEITETICGKIR